MGKADRHQGAGHLLKEVALIVVSAVVLSLIVRTFLLQAFYVPTGSMENTLLPSDRIIASKITTTLSGVKRGEIVVFKDPGDWLPPVTKQDGNPIRGAFEFLGLLPSNTGDDLVKRVIGVAGDNVKCCSPEGKIVLNGVPLEEPYLKPGVRTDQVRFDVTVPPKSIFVMGDNRPSSADSRFHLQDNSGTVPVDNVVGRVVLLVWPFDRISTEPIPPVPFDDPKLNQK